MILIVIMQFAMGFISIMLRYCERGCCSRIWRGLLRMFRNLLWCVGCCGCLPCMAALSCFGLCKRFTFPSGLAPLSPQWPPPAVAEADPEAAVGGHAPPGADQTGPHLPVGAPAINPGQNRQFPSFHRRRCCCFPFHGGEDVAPEVPRARRPSGTGAAWLLASAVRVMLALPSCLAAGVRWYWFHLSCQVGLMCREVMVISMLDGWYLEVITANVAMWLVIMLTARQVWLFSHVRHQAPKAIDQVLDMLLLPINYGFLCALCVRILKLENTTQNRMIVLAMIDSADIWESWALWSVLKLFVRIVETASDKVVKKEQEKAENSARRVRAVEEGYRRAATEADEARRHSQVSASESLKSWWAAHNERAGDGALEEARPGRLSEASQRIRGLQGKRPSSSASAYRGRPSSESTVGREASRERPSQSTIHAASDSSTGPSRRAKHFEQQRRRRSRSALRRPNGQEAEEVSQEDQVPSSGAESASPPGRLKKVRMLSTQAEDADAEETPNHRASSSRAWPVPDELDSFTSSPAKGAQTADLQDIVEELGKDTSQAEIGSSSGRLSPPSPNEVEPSFPAALMTPRSRAGSDPEKSPVVRRGGSRMGAGPALIPALLSPNKPKHGPGRLVSLPAAAQNHPVLGASRSEDNLLILAQSSKVQKKRPYQSTAGLSTVSLRPEGEPQSPAGSQGLHVITPASRTVTQELQQQHSFQGGPGGGLSMRYKDIVKAYKRLSLWGVQGWVAFLLVTNALEIFVKGLIAPGVPTLCYWVYQDCMSCNDWYNLHIYTASQGITYLLCSAAIIFVIYFERVFKDDLHRIEPYWKFWGVKIVVTVTYFQWLVFRWVFRLDDQKIYLTHSVTCCLEMPVLCWLHATYAYPYGKEWVDHLLEIPYGETSQAPEKRKSSPDQDPQPGALPLDQVEVPHSKCYQRLQMLLYLLLAALCILLSIRTVTWILPPVYDLLPTTPEYNITCSEDDIDLYIKEHERSLHWQMIGDRTRGGPFTFRLPLCDTMSVPCALGYNGSPTVTCQPDGRYDVEGTCKIVGCGPPRKIDHAEIEVDEHEAREGFTAGMRVWYRCNAGYRGRPYATCGADGVWRFPAGKRCTIVGCGSLGNSLDVMLPNWRSTMHMIGHHNLTISHIGEVVRFVCPPGLWGSPVATCEQGGEWLLTDPCQPFPTSRRCSCKAHWSHCSGWFGTHCQELFGCTTPSKGGSEPYGWCKVKAGSCPSSATDPFSMEPTWDYCVGDNFNTTWKPRGLPDKSGWELVTNLYEWVPFFLTAAIAFCCMQWLAQVWVSLCTKLLPCLLQVGARMWRLVVRLPPATRRWWRIAAWECRVAWRASSRASQAAWSRARSRVNEVVATLYAKASKAAADAQRQVSDFQTKVARSCGELRACFTDGFTACPDRVARNVRQLWAPSRNRLVSEAESEASSGLEEPLLSPTGQQSSSQRSLWETWSQPWKFSRWLEGRVQGLRSSGTGRSEGAATNGFGPAA